MRRCFAVTLADRIRFGSMVVVSGIATTAAVSTSSPAKIGLTGENLIRFCYANAKEEKNS
jgi:hypothetical protein